MRVLNPPPFKDEEFTLTWRNWLNLFYSTFLGIQLIDSETIVASATVKKSIVYADATSGALTVTLPLVANSNKQVFYIKKIDVSVNAVTIDGNGSETIDGATTQSLPNQWDVMILQCNGSAWYLLSTG